MARREKYSDETKVEIIRNLIEHVDFIKKYIQKKAVAYEQPPVIDNL